MPGSRCDPELAIGRDHELDRPFDAGAERRRAVEILRQEDRAQQRRDLVIAVAEHGAELRLRLGRNILAHEEPIDFAGHEFGRDLLLENDAEDVDAVEVSGSAEKGLLSVVVLCGVDLEIEIVIDPAGESARRFADILLAVVADAHGEELHHLAGEILVRGTFHVLGGVEIGEHRRPTRDFDQQRAEIAGRLAVQQGKLLLHLAIVADLFLAGGEMAVPEQGHLLFQRMVGRDHAVGPPKRKTPRLEHRRAQPIEEAVDDRLQAPLARRLHARAQRLAVFLGALGRRNAARRKVLERGIPYARLIERLEVIVGDGAIVDEVRNRIRGLHRGELRDLLRRAAEAGTFEQVGSAIKAPFARGNRREIVRPCGRPCTATPHLDMAGDK